jgi:hypothetical protein
MSKSPSRSLSNAIRRTSGDRAAKTSPTGAVVYHDSTVTGKGSGAHLIAAKGCNASTEVGLDARVIKRGCRFESQRQAVTGADRFGVRNH